MDKSEPGPPLKQQAPRGACMNLEKPFFRKRQRFAGRNHEVVQYPHAYKS